MNMLRQKLLALQTYVQAGGSNEIRPRYQHVLGMMQRLWELFGDGNRPGYPRNQSMYTKALSEDEKEASANDDANDSDFVVHDVCGLMHGGSPTFPLCRTDTESQSESVNKSKPKLSLRPKSTSKAQVAPP